ncbi:hypothetical protein CVT26_011559, partial [Gymnopilus dilepis]
DTLPEPTLVAEGRIEASTSIGKDSLWSSENLYRHLLWLEGLVPWPVLAAADKYMVINMEDVVPVTTVSQASLSTLSGSIAYNAVSTSRRGAEITLTRPGLHHLERLGLHSFFIIAGKPFDLAEGGPQAVSELYSRESFSNKVPPWCSDQWTSWIFLYLEFADDYKAASYSESSVINWTTHMDPNGEREVDKPRPEVIAAILADWVCLVQYLIESLTH